MTNRPQPESLEESNHQERFDWDQDRYADSMFLTSDPSEVEEFFDRLQILPSPLREQTFVDCCLSGSLSFSRL